MPFSDPEQKRRYQQVYQARYHQENRQKRAQQKRERKDVMRSWLDGLKRDPCSRCGIVFAPICMDWHHIDGDKEINLGSAVQQGWGKTRILAEISKCVLLCACCHRLEHA